MAGQYPYPWPAGGALPPKDDRGDQVPLSARTRKSPRRSPAMFSIATTEPAGDVATLSDLPELPTFGADAPDLSTSEGPNRTASEPLDSSVSRDRESNASMGGPIGPRTAVGLQPPTLPVQLAAAALLSAVGAAGGSADGASSEISSSVTSRSRQEPARASNESNVFSSKPPGQPVSGLGASRKKGSRRKGVIAQEDFHAVEGSQVLCEGAPTTGVVNHKGFAQEPAACDLVPLPMRATSVSRRPRSPPLERRAPSYYAESSTPAAERSRSSASFMPAATIVHQETREEASASAASRPRPTAKAQAFAEDITRSESVLQRCSGRVAAMCAVVWVSGLCGGTWIQTHHEVLVLREELHAALESFQGNEDADLLPGGMHWITAATQLELRELLSKLERPAGTASAMPQVVADIPGMRLPAGSSLLRHSLERKTLSDVGRAVGQGVRMLELLSSAVAADFPVAMLYKVPGESSRSESSQNTCAHEMEKKQPGQDQARTRELKDQGPPNPSPSMLRDLVQAHGLDQDLKETAQLLKDVHIPLLAAADAKLQAGGRYGQMASPLGDGFRLIASQELALQELQNALRTEVTRLSHAIASVELRADEALLIAGACTNRPSFGGTSSCNSGSGDVSDLATTLHSSSGVAVPASSSGVVMEEEVPAAAAAAATAAAAAAVPSARDEALIVLAHGDRPVGTAQLALEAAMSTSAFTAPTSESPADAIAVAGAKAELGGNQGGTAPMADRGIMAQLRAADGQPGENRTAEVIEMFSRAMNSLSREAAPPALSAARTHAEAAFPHGEHGSQRGEEEEFDRGGHG